MTYKTGLAKFMGNQRMRIIARLRRPFREYLGEHTGLDRRNWQALDDPGWDEVPDNYRSRQDLMASTVIERRR